MEDKKNISAEFKRKLSTPVHVQSAENMGLESMVESIAPIDATETMTYNTELSSAAISDRTDASKEELYRIIKEYLGDNPDLYAIADKIAAQGKDALKAVEQEDDDYFEKNPDSSSFLEVIVKTDGSRPSFMIRNGAIDRASSPVGDWGDFLDMSEAKLNEAIACVGRINVMGNHIGTGFTVHENLIITNRHVLEAISDRSGNIYPGAVIDFGFEYRGIQSFNPRTLQSVVFSGPNLINGRINHKNLDLALIKLSPSQNHAIQTKALSFDITPNWNFPDDNVYTIGYPGQPSGGTYQMSLLELLFSNTFGCKRLAPGRIMNSQAGTEAWTATHDATTLGGNSGSVILVRNNETYAAGLHYGGTLGEPRANWGHILGATLNTLGREGRTLKDCLEEYQVQLA